MDKTTCPAFIYSTRSTIETQVQRHIRICFWFHMKRPYTTHIPEAKTEEASLSLSYDFFLTVLIFFLLQEKKGSEKNGTTNPRGNKASRLFVQLPNFPLKTKSWLCVAQQWWEEMSRFHVYERSIISGCNYPLPHEGPQFVLSNNLHVDVQHHMYSHRP